MPGQPRPQGGFPDDLAEAGKREVKKYNAEKRRLADLRRLHDAEQRAQERGDSLRQFGGEGRDNREQWDNAWNGESPVPNYRVPFTDDWFDSHQPGTNNPFDTQGSWSEDATTNWQKGHTFLFPWDWRALGLDAKDYPGHIYDQQFGPGTGDAPAPTPNTHPDQAPSTPKPPPGWTDKAQPVPASANHDLMGVVARAVHMMLRPDQYAPSRKTTGAFE